MKDDKSADELFTLAMQQNKALQDQQMLLNQHMLRAQLNSSPFFNQQAYSAGAAAGRGLLGQLSGIAPGMQQLQQQDMRPYIKDIEKNKRAVAWLETTYPEIHQQWEALYALQESIAKDEGGV